MSWLGVDIGGANLKVADGQDFASSVPFPLWKQPEQLEGALRELLAAAPDHDNIAVTITGELADCYQTKAEGITAIVDAMTAASERSECFFYQTTGSLVSADEAKASPLLTAASNWHALASLAGRVAPSGHALLIDIGSTTSDIIPLRDGQPIALGSNDPERLRYRELVYTGVQRSPICALVDSLRWQGHECPVAQELFATTKDAYLLLGNLPEDEYDTTTADGRPATQDAAHDRMARSICADRTMFTAADAKTAADTVVEAQMVLLAQAIAHVIDHNAEPQTVVLSGEGEFLAVRVLDYLGLAKPRISLAKEYGEAASWCGPAYALATLADELVKP